LHYVGSFIILLYTSVSLESSIRICMISSRSLSVFPEL
jgi:hypothetical protein